MNLEQLRALPGYRASLEKALRYIPDMDDAERFLLDNENNRSLGEVSDDLLSRVIDFVREVDAVGERYGDAARFAEKEQATLLQELERVKAAR